MSVGVLHMPASWDHWDANEPEPTTPVSLAVQAQIARDRATLARRLAMRFGFNSLEAEALGLDEPLDILEATAQVAELAAEADALMRRVDRLERGVA